MQGTYSTDVPLISNVRVLDEVSSENESAVKKSRNRMHGTERTVMLFLSMALVCVGFTVIYLPV